MNAIRNATDLYYVSAYRYDSEHALIGAINAYEYPMSYSDAWAAVRDLRSCDPITYDAATIDATVSPYPCDCGNDATVRLSDTFAVCESCA